MASDKIKLHRSPTDVSTKVIAAALAQLGLAVVLALISGDINGPELVAAGNAVVTAVVGYFTADRIAT